jgi:hypothetical protein
MISDFFKSEKFADIRLKLGFKAKGLYDPSKLPAFGEKENLYLKKSDMDEELK